MLVGIRGGKFLESGFLGGCLLGGRLRILGVPRLPILAGRLVLGVLGLGASFGRFVFVVHAVTHWGSLDVWGCDGGDSAVVLGQVVSGGEPEDSGERDENEWYGGRMSHYPLLAGHDCDDARDEHVGVELVVAVVLLDRGCHGVQVVLERCSVCLRTFQTEKAVDRVDQDVANGRDCHARGDCCDGDVQKAEDG